MLLEPRLRLRPITKNASLAALIHVDDAERAAAHSMLVAPDALRYADLGIREQAFARMLFYTLWDDGGGFATYDDGLGHLRSYQFVCREIRQVVNLGVAASKHAAKSLGAGLQHVPLLSHGTYRREEILAALQYGSLEQGKNVQHREGVAWCPATSTDAFFITLNKDDKHSVTTMYRTTPSARNCSTGSRRMRPRQPAPQAAAILTGLRMAREF